MRCWRFSSPLVRSFYTPGRRIGLRPAHRGVTPTYKGFGPILNPEEAARFLQETLEQFDMDRRDGAEIESGFGSDVERAYNQFW